MVNKRLVVLNTVYGMLQYLIFDKNWKMRSYIIFSKRIPKEIIKSFKREAKNTVVLESYQIRFRTSTGSISLVQTLKGVRELKLYKSICKEYFEVFGNMEIFYLSDKRIKKTHFDDGLSTLNLLNNKADKRWNGQKKLKKLLHKFFGIDLEFHPFEYNYVLPDSELYHGLESNYKVVFLDFIKKWSYIPSSERLIIHKIFGYSAEKNSDDLNGKNILLTQPLSEDYFCTEGQKIDLYREMIYQEKVDESKLVIKPHPFETTNYGKYFPKSIILPKYFPSDLLLMDDVVFEKALTMFSTAVNNVKAKEIYFAGTPRHFNIQFNSSYRKYFDY